MDLTKIKNELIKNLSTQDLTELSIVLAEYLETVIGTDISVNEITDKRFAEGLVCPHCNKRHIVKNGKVRGKQRYLCMDCKKTFNTLTNTIFSNTKLPSWCNYRCWFSYKMDCRKNQK